MLSASTLSSCTSASNWRFNKVHSVGLATKSRHSHVLPLLDYVGNYIVLWGYNYNLILGHE
jgi:hypothetical protein